jgi:uncharacterized RDD family membrane protein YckC
VRCPTCGYVSFDHLAACKHCGADLRDVARRRGVALIGGVSAPDDSAWRAYGPAGEAAAHEEKGPEPPGWIGRERSVTNSTERAVTEPWEGQRTFDMGAHVVDGTGESHSGMVLATADAPERAWTETQPKAGFWVRAAAWLADICCLFLITIALAVVVLTTIWFGGRLGGEINEQVMALAGASAALIVTATGFGYFTLFTGACGQTPGKMLFGLKVVRVTGQEMTYARACVRSACWILSLVLFSIGFLMIAFARQKQGLHDVLAGTYVIRASRPQ